MVREINGVVLFFMGTVMTDGNRWGALPDGS